MTRVSERNKFLPQLLFRDVFTRYLGLKLEASLDEKLESIIVVTPSFNLKFSTTKASSFMATMIFV